MLSTFSNFLPQGFSFGTSFKDRDVVVTEEPEQSPHAQDLPTSASPEPIAGQGDGEQVGNTKRRRERLANEVRVFVSHVRV